MLRRIAIGTVVLMILAATAASVAASDVDADLERLRALEGEWVQVGEDGGSGATVTSVWHVTAAGSAVVETLFPGTDHEMVTVYHADGDALMLTHYCAGGNQPRMRQTAASSGTVLDFACDGGTNMVSESDTHMHHATLVWVDDDHIRATWTSYDGGAPGHVVEFDLVRKP